MENLLRVMWLAVVVWTAHDMVPILLSSGDEPFHAIRRDTALGGLWMVALAVTVLALLFAKPRILRWTLLILACLWALYFFLSLVAGDEGAWYAARLPPAIGLVVSVLTVRWARGQLRPPP